MPKSDWWGKSDCPLDPAPPVPTALYSRPSRLTDDVVVQDQAGRTVLHGLDQRHLAFVVLYRKNTL